MSVDLSLPSALQVVEALFKHVFWCFGLPENILSDCGPQFISRVWKAFFQRLGVTVSLTSGYHPESNSQDDHSIQELCRFLWAYCSSRQHDWADFLAWAEYAKNSLSHSTTGLTPFECVLSYQPLLYPWDSTPTNVTNIRAHTNI